MKYDWQTSTVGEVCSLVTDGSHFSPKSVDDGEYMVSVRDFTEYGFDFTSCKKISREDYETLEKNGCVPEQNDILIGKDGARYFEDIVLYRQPERPALLSSIAILRCDKGKMLPEYLYYIMRTPFFKQDVRDNYGSGSAIPRIILKDFKRMPISYPPLDQQQKIVSILAALDNRIQTNVEINKNLSELLQAVYQQWFTVNEQTSRGGTLADICDYSRDKVAVSDLSLSTYFSTENMLPRKNGAVNASSLPTIAQTTKCKMGDVLISNIRPYFKKIVYCHSECGCSTDVLCFTPKTSELSAYLYSTLYSDRFFDFMVAGSKGTKMPRGDKQQIMTYPLYKPSDTELEAFNQIAEPILACIENNRIENINLSALRDGLLPKLMFGEIDVRSVNN